MSRFERLHSKYVLRKAWHSGESSTLMHLCFRGTLAAINENASENKKQKRSPALLRLERRVFFHALRLANAIQQRRSDVFAVHHRFVGGASDR